MNLRTARPEDAKRISEISLAALGYASLAADTLRRLTAALANPEHLVLVAEDESGRVVGFLHACGYATLYCDPLKYVMALAVDPAHQGLGIGRALVIACENWAKSAGAVGVRLSSGSDRLGAHAFYQRLGYTVRKEQKSIWKIF